MTDEPVTDELSTAPAGVETPGQTNAVPGARKASVRLGDDLFLCVHDFEGDRPRLSLSVLQAVMAGGVISELVLAGKLTVRGSTLVVTDARPSADPLVHHVLADILAQAQSPARDLAEWLTALGRPSVGWIADRLLTAGVLVPTSARRRSADIGLGYAPRNADIPGQPAARVACALAAGAPLSDHDRCLAALLHASGLTSLIIPAGHAREDLLVLDAELAFLPDPLTDIHREIASTITTLTGPLPH
ncbi:GOLPH3/VPS74 family protein [Cryptosporangium minutisporangium]|uniref:GPP34 family phosphoprotein n=1 Tax=Cryptosporangium minutisporangium TaxID=113569 RepID=A0ABP6T2I2_9ACTN